MKQVSKGQEALSTGMKPTRAGQVLCGDTFGPIAIPGLAGERYFLVLVCQFTRWGVVRTCTSLKEVPELVEEMILELPLIDLHLARGRCVVRLASLGWGGGHDLVLR